MERASRSELLTTVSSQREKLEKYETKLKDLVHAYRGLLKEKEALEASVSVLNASTNETQHNSEDVSVDPLDAQAVDKQKASSSSSEEERVKILTGSLAAVSQEKSRLEAIYIAEKKQLKQEYEELRETMEREREARNGEILELTNQMQELKNRIRKQQHEREKEQTDHVVMLRELQKLLAEERSAKEKVELEHDESKFTLKEVEKELSVCQDSQEKLSAVTQELEQVQKVLKLTQEKVEKSDKPSPLVSELRQEIADLKLEHDERLLIEQKRATEADDRSRQSANRDEARISSLEAKISQLSDTVGDYERTRSHDQEALTRLKERVAQLDEENRALTQALSSQDDSGVATVAPVEGATSVQELAARVTALVSQLSAANDASDDPINIADLVGYDRRQESGECRRHREELEQLREEFECYKLRAQSVLKNRNSKDGSTTKEMEALKTQILDMKEKLRGAYSNCDDLQEKHDREVEESRRNLVTLQESQKQQVARLNSEHRQQLAELELELRKQRARTVTLLAEKDRDLEQMRHLTSAPRFDTDAWLERNAGASEEVVHTGLVRTRSQEEQAVVNLMNQSMFSGSHESMLYVHFTEEQARKTAELNTLRKQKRQLESALRELQHSETSKEQTYSQRLEELEEEVRKQQRDKSRESANLEYLKNVTYRFLTSTDIIAKERMVNAIATILQFSPAEKQTAHHHKTTWW